MFIFLQYWFVILIILIKFQPTNEFNEQNSLVECFSNINIWKMYLKHFTFANTVKVKILTISNQNERHIDDAASIILQSVQSFLSVKTVEIQQRKLEGSAHVEIENVPLTVETSGRKRNEYSSSKYEILRSSSDPEEAYIIVAWSEQVIYQFLQDIPGFVLPKSRALYVILLIFKQESICMKVFEGIGNMLDMLWKKYNILNVVVQAPCSCNSDDIYVFKPFEVKGDRQGLLHINKVEQVLDNEYLIFNRIKTLRGTALNISLFEREPTTMLHVPASIANYSIYGCVKNRTGFYGLDANILAGMAEILNFNIKFTNLPNNYYGKVLDNGTILGSLGEVVRKEVQLAANARFISDYSTSCIEFTKAIQSEKICLIVPKSLRKPQWMSIFYCFKYSVWLLLMSVLVISITIWYLYQKSFAGKKDISNICLEIYSICFSVPVNIHAKGTISLFIATLMLFNLVINGIFQGNLITSFSKNVYFPDIDTLEELADSNLKIHATFHLFGELSSELSKKLQEKVDNRYHDMGGKEMAAYLRTWATAERQSDARLLLETKYTNEMGEPLLHIVSECPDTAFLAYIVPAGSPLLPKFNYIIQMFLEGGFIGKWNNDIVDAIIAAKHLRHKKSESPTKLSVRDVQPAFFVIIIGHGTSMAIFLIELNLWRFSKFALGISIKSTRRNSRE